MEKCFCDQTGQELTGGLRYKIYLLNDNDSTVQPTPEEQDLMIKAGKLAFTNIPAMIEYFTSNPNGEEFMS